MYIHAITVLSYYTVISGGPIDTRLSSLQKAANSI